MISPALWPLVLKTQAPVISRDTDCVSDSFIVLNTEFTKRVVLFEVYGRLGEPFSAKPNMRCTAPLMLYMGGGFEVVKLQRVPLLVSNICHKMLQNRIYFKNSTVDLLICRGAFV